MNRSDLTVDMPVVVYLGFGNGHRARPGKVVRIARKYVSIEYEWLSGTRQTDEFSIEDQRIRGAQFAYATFFRTVEQDELESREKVVRDGLREFGLLPKYTGPTTKFTLTLEDMEAVLALLTRRYPDAQP